MPCLQMCELVSCCPGVLRAVQIQLRGLSRFFRSGVPVQGEGGEEESLHLPPCSV